MKTQRNILIAFLLNFGFSVFELVGGILTGSVAIISDAIHDFGDAISIGAAFLLERKSRQKPDESHSYGYARYSVLGAAITNLILFVGSGVVIYNAVDRIIHPVSIHADGMILMAVLGAAMNLAAAWFTHGGDSLNEKAVNLHMLEDVLGWVVVLVGAVVIRFTSFTLLDPLMSIAVALFILANAWKGMGEVLDVFLEKTPRDVDPEEIAQHLLYIPSVKDVHHLHVWTLDGVTHCASVHVAIDECDRGMVKARVRAEFRQQGVDHVTIELEGAEECCHSTTCDPQNKEKRPHHCHHHHH